MKNRKEKIMRLEEVKALKVAAVEKFKERRQKAVSSGEKFSAREAVCDELKSFIMLAGELATYINNEVLNDIGISDLVAPFIVGGLMSVVDAVADGICEGDEKHRENLMETAASVAAILGEHREVITVKMAKDVDQEED